MKTVTRFSGRNYLSSFIYILIQRGQYKRRHVDERVHCCICVRTWLASPWNQPSSLCDVTHRDDQAAAQMAHFRGVLIGADILFGKASNYIIDFVIIKNTIF